MPSSLLRGSILGALGGGVSYQTAAFVQSVAATAAQNPTLNITTTSGNLLILLAQAPATNTLFPTSITGGTWASMGQQGVAGNLHAVQVYCRAAAGGSEAITANYASGTVNAMTVFELSGLTTTFTEAHSSTAFASARTFASLTPGNANTAILAIQANHSGSTAWSVSSVGSTLPSITKVVPAGTGAATHVMALSPTATVAAHQPTTAWTTGRTSVGWTAAFDRKVV